MMKKLLTVLILSLSLAFFQGLPFSVPVAIHPALAADLQNGAVVFRNNCAMCHKGGNNTIVADKTLKKNALERYGKNSITAIMTQIKLGMKTMPSFQAKLTGQEIEDVANYVIQQAESGW